MSKKTRKEKIIADLRRKLNRKRTLSSASNNSSFQNSSSLDIAYDKPFEEINYSWKTKKKGSILNPSEKLLLTYEAGYIKKDLRNTLIVTFLILAIEILLYFVLEKGLIF